LTESARRRRLLPDAGTGSIRDYSEPEIIPVDMTLTPETVKILAAEFLGMLLFLIVGFGANVQNLLNPGDTHSDVLWTWGFAVLLGIAVAGPVSGAHFNPAVTISLWVYHRSRSKHEKRQSLAMAAAYIGVQTLAALLAAAIVFGIYYESINEFDGGVRQIFGPQGTAGLFPTFPKSYISVWTALFDQILGTAVLLLIIFAMNDHDRCAFPSGSQPFIIALTIVAIGMSLGFNCGYPINPARDFGPRLFTWMAGYGNQVWHASPAGYWWIPIIGPILGGLLGGGVYRVFIG